MWFLNIPAGLLNGLIGAIIGGFLALGGQLLSNWESRRRRQNHLRQALISEILSMRVDVIVQDITKEYVLENIDPDELPEGAEEQLREIFDVDIEHAQEEGLQNLLNGVIEGFRESSDMGTLDPETLYMLREGSDVVLPTQIFDDNRDKIGQLTPEEIDLLINLYNFIDILKSVLGTDVMEEVLFIESNLPLPVSDDQIFDTELLDEDFREQGKAIVYMLFIFVYFLKNQTLEKLREEYNPSLAERIFHTS